MCYCVHVCALEQEVYVDLGGYWTSGEGLGILQLKQRIRIRIITCARMNRPNHHMCKDESSHVQG